MNLRRILRALILSEIVIGVAAVVATSRSRQLWPQITHSRLSPGLGLVSLIMLALTVLGGIGLWRMWRRGRGAFTAAWLLSLIVVTLGGPYVYSSVAELLVDLTVALNGAILALIWFSDLRSEFGSPVVTGRVP